MNKPTGIRCRKGSATARLSGCRWWPILTAILVLCVAGPTPAPAQSVSATSDWPQWRGPDRSGRSPETGLFDQWPESGPPPVWKVEGLGAGFGSLAVVETAMGPRVFLQMQVGRQSAVAALDAADGRLVWSRAIGPSRDNDRGPGPRATPTVVGDRIYALTENGDLAALRVNDGEILWQRNILNDFNGSNIEWLLSESPLVDDDHVYVTPGGRGAGIVALDPDTGRTMWVSDDLGDRAGYASLILENVGGVPILMTLTAAAGVGVRATDGALMWRYTESANRTANAATPVFAGDQVFFSSSYGGGGGLVRLTASGGTVGAEEVYHTRNMENHHGGMIYVDGYLYGFHNSILTCLDFATGERMWRDRSVGKGAIAYADGHLYILSENNRVGLVEANPAEYVEKGRFEIEDEGLSSWAHPVISGGRLYIRNQGTVMAWDVRGR